MDVTGTIVSFRGSLEEHYIGAAKKCGIHEIDGTKINEAFSRAYNETCNRYPCFGGDDISAKQVKKDLLSAQSIRILQYLTIFLKILVVEGMRDQLISFGW